jgi:hypothetical protein
MHATFISLISHPHCSDLAKGTKPESVRIYFKSYLNGRRLLRCHSTGKSVAYRHEF